jgi:hypothetical protein
MKSASSPSAKPRRAKRSGSLPKSRTDWKRLAAPGRAGQPDAEHPEFDPAHVVRGIVRCGLKPVPANECSPCS